MSRRKRTFSRATLFRRGFLAVTVVLSWGAAAPVFAANLENLDLRGVDLSGADLSDSNLGGADLIGAGLRGADLSGADLRGALMIKAVLAGANMAEADLSDAILRGADLRDCDLRGADLRDGFRIERPAEIESLDFRTDGGGHLLYGDGHGKTRVSALFSVPKIQHSLS